jgi:hypothetical protein
LRKFLAGLTVAAFLSFATHAHAADAPPPDQWRMFDREWIAESTTSMGVTGNARLTPTSVTFAGRVTYRLRYISEIMTIPSEMYRNTRRFSLFEFIDPKPQTILRGNTLCGHKSNGEVPLPRYLAAGLSPEPDDHDYLSLVVFVSERPPEDATQPGNGFCASYGYFRERKH